MKTRWTKTGEPVVGTSIRSVTVDGEAFETRVVGKLYGRGPEGRRGLIGVIVEDVEQGGRQTIEWPVTRLNGEPVPRSELEWAS